MADTAWTTTHPDYLRGYRDAVIDTLRRIADTRPSRASVQAEADKWEALTVTTEGLR